MPLPRLLMLVAALLLTLRSAPAAAFDLFATHEVTVQFATADGKPLADAEVTVFAPGDLGHPVKSGKTDKDGKFEFGTDRDGMWTVEARSSGDIERETIRVGGGGGGSDERGTSPFLVFGALGALLAIAVLYRYLRARSRARGRIGKH
jgi:nickel transport protein